MKYIAESFDDFKKNLNEEQTDPELATNMQEDIIKKSGECPRCGSPDNECICQERDQFSTVNLFRAPSGEKKDKGEFK
jgi:hypothetical protein